MDSSKYIAFISYDRDVNFNGAVTRFSKSLENELETRLAPPYSVFQDLEGLGWGDNWWEKVKSELEHITFFIPVITPTFFRSKNCRKEINAFIDIEAQHNDNSRKILPVLFIETFDSSEFADDDLVQAIRELNYIDWTELRFKDESDSLFQKEVSEAAAKIEKFVIKTRHDSDTKKATAEDKVEVSNNKASDEGNEETEEQTTKIEQQDLAEIKKKTRIWSGLLATFVACLGGYYFYCQQSNCSSFCFLCAEKVPSPGPLLVGPDVVPPKPKEEIIGAASSPEPVEQIAELKPPERVEQIVGGVIMLQATTSYKSNSEDSGKRERLNKNQHVVDVWSTEDEKWIAYKTENGDYGYFLRSKAKISNDQ